MGRKRKTRWRRLSIGGDSGNDEEDCDGEFGSSSNLEGLGTQLNGRVRSGSQPSINSYSTFEPKSPLKRNSMSSSTSPPSPVLPQTENESGERCSKIESSQKEETQSTMHHNNYHYNTHSDYRHNNGYHGSQYHYNKERDYSHHHHMNNQNHHNGFHPPHSLHNGHSHGGQYGNGQSPGYYNGNGYGYNRNNGYRHEGSYRGGRGGGSDYHHYNSRFGGNNRFRKPRPYGSQYYYQNGREQQGSDDATTTKPSYNQDEYTKITTPRQDVLFKKGYLSQRKTVTQSSSVDSASGPTTPTASTNGTPDTHSTNGINSDYSEGVYENGETECEVLPYDETVYYAPPTEAVFTDPNTGQVYYGQSNGEYFDAYPVSPLMLTGYPGPLYYHLPYPGVDWNGIPAPIYPIVTSAHLPVEEQIMPPLQHQSFHPMEQLMGHHKYVHGRYMNGGYEKEETKHSSDSKKISPHSNGHKTSSDSEDNSKPSSTSSGEKCETISRDEESEKSSSKLKNHKSEVGDDKKIEKSEDESSSSSSTLSSAPSTPLVTNGGNLDGLSGHMSQLSLDGQLMAQPPPIHLPPIPLQHFIPTQPMHHHHHVQPLHHAPHQPILYHHPFVYAPPPPPPIYNGIVVPTPSAINETLTEPITSPSPTSKKRKKRQRKKEGQLTDESSDELSISKDESSNETLSKRNLSLSPSPISQTSENLPSHISSENITNKLDIVKNFESTSEEEKSESFEVINNKTILNLSHLNEGESVHDEISKIKLENVTVLSSVENIEHDLINLENLETLKDNPINPFSEPLVEKINSTYCCSKNASIESSSNSFNNSNLNINDDSSLPKILEISQELGSQSVSLVAEKVVGEETTSEKVDVVENSDEDKTLHSAQITESLPKPSLISKDKKCVPGLLLLPPELNLELSSLEPSSPDSFNTTQSVAGSEVQSVSISETDFMNRTTSLDEVEEDLPHENEEEISIPSLLSPTQKVSTNLGHEKFDPKELMPSKSSVSEAIFFSTPETSPSDSNECSPSAESLFEKQLELSVEEPEKIVIKPTRNAKIKKSPEKVFIRDDRPSIEEILLNNKSLIESSPRPQSLTLAVSEWLREQGVEKALTPASQLRELYRDESEEEDGYDSDSTSLTADDLNGLNNDQIQKNVNGNPWVVSSSKSVSRLNRVGYKKSRATCSSSSKVSSLDDTSRVASLSSSTSETSLEMSKSHQLVFKNFENEDSGLELSSPESTSPHKLNDTKLSQAQEKNLFDNEIGLSENAQIACQPEKFLKYYQLGVVADVESSEEELREDYPQVMKICDQDEEVGTFVNDTIKKYKKDLYEPHSTVINTAPNSHLYINPLSIRQEILQAGANHSLVPVDDLESLPDYISPPTSNLDSSNNEIEKSSELRAVHTICCSLQ